MSLPAKVKPLMIHYLYESYSRPLCHWQVEKYQTCTGCLLLRNRGQSSTKCHFYWHVLLSFRTKLKTYRLVESFWEISLTPTDAFDCFFSTIQWVSCFKNTDIFQMSSKLHFQCMKLNKNSLSCTFSHLFSCIFVIKWQILRKFNVNCTLALTVRCESRGNSHKFSLQTQN